MLSREAYASRAKVFAPLFIKSGRGPGQGPGGSRAAPWRGSGWNPDGSGAEPWRGPGRRPGDMFYDDFRCAGAGSVLHWRRQTAPAMKGGPAVHIPGCLTTELEIQPFEAALAAAQAPSPDYDASRWLYVPNTYREYRYILATRGERPLICVGVNPSTAAPGALDPTLQSVERVARGNGYDSFIMFNVYAQRATRPKDMEREMNEALHRENMAALAWALGQSAEPAVWCAWGTVIEQRPYLARCVRDMVDIGRRYGARWFTAGARSKKGHPHHPLYLRSDSTLDPFDAASYAAGL